MSRGTRDVFSEVNKHGRSRKTVYSRTTDRYPDIGTIKHSKGREQDPEMEYRTKGGSYYNATKVIKIEASAEYPKFSLIACSAPSGETFNSFGDMVFMGNKVDSIIVLGPADPIRLPDYWSKAKSLGCRNPYFPYLWKYEIINKSSEPLGGYGFKHTIEITNLDSNKSKTLPLYHFGAWRDRGAPDNPDDFEDFVKMIYEETHRKLIVHCSAGVGRTGTFAACLDSLIEIKTNKTPEQIVLELRSHRNMMVQTYEQFDIVCKFMARRILENKSSGAYKEMLSRLPEGEKPPTEVKWTDDLNYDLFFGGPEEDLEKSLLK